MASRNVETVKSQLEGFNRHDVNAAVEGYANDVRFTDHAFNLSLKSPQEIKDHTKMYIDSASDGKVTIREMIDAGDTVVAELTFSGTNDGQMGPMKPTGRRMSIDAVNILHFDKNGMIMREDWYYDQMSMMVQLGHMEQPMTM